MQDLKCFDFAFKQEVERNILTALLMSDRAYEIINTIWNGKENDTGDLMELFDGKLRGCAPANVNSGDIAHNFA